LKIQNNGTALSKNHIDSLVIGNRVDKSFVAAAPSVMRVKTYKVRFYETPTSVATFQIN
jgi:hypothetical protein